MRKFVILILMFLSIANILANDPRTYYRNAIVFVYSPVNSIFEDDNIILQIYNGRLYARNKTEKTIFIDLSQCFLINNGSSYPMFSKATDENKASKANISSSIDEFISIAPATGTRQNDTYIATLEQGIYGTYTTTESPLGRFSDYDMRFLRLINDMLKESKMADPKRKEYTGTVSRHLTEDESISNIGASIAYSFNKRSDEWTNITITTWVSDVIFTPYFAQLPFQNQYQKGFDVKNTDDARIYVRANSPFEFDTDKSPIIIADWEGNFNNGTFTLRDIKLELKDKKKSNNGRDNSGKILIKFQGSDQDWGKLKYTKYGKTSQEGINRFSNSNSNVPSTYHNPGSSSTYHIQYVKRLPDGEGEEIVREETVKANPEQLATLIKAWKNQGANHNCIIKRLD